MIRRFFLVLLAALALLPASVAAEPVARMTEAEAAQVQSALNRGLDLINYDQAAWHTTDAMLEDLPEPGKAGVVGWVVVPVTRGWQVTYWRADGDSFAGVYSAVWDGTAVSERQLLTGNATTLTAEQLALVRAGRVPEPDSLPRCSTARFNPVIMPSGKANGSTYVYFLTPQETLDSIPLGGHYRFEVLDGKVIDQRGFTRSCISLALKGKDGKRPEALVVSHLLDPVPTEIHVFSVSAASLPIFVSTVENKKLWSVEISQGQPRVRLLKQD